MSQINTTNIDETFPIQGQDNPSQGFRDNFNAIKQALIITKSEITSLETTSAKLDDDNDFNGNTIEDALLNNTPVLFKNKGTTVGPLTINVKEALVQKVTFTGDSVLRLSNWPTNTSIAKCHKVRVHIKFELPDNDPDRLTRRVNFSTDQGGVIKSYTTGEPFYYVNTLGGWHLRPYSNIDVNANINSYEHVIEAWSYDSGNNVFIRYLGSFA